jgi:HD-like signal output (HDOD) protein
MLRMKRSRPEDGAAELRRVLRGSDIPTIPKLVAVAIEQVSDPECDLREVADTIGLDPGTSARLLSIVNSAAFAPRNPIVGVRQAVTMLGKNRVESLLVSLAVSTAVSKPVPGFDIKDFWRKAAWRAAAAAALSRRVDRAGASANFSAALLQDIAMPLLVASEPRYSGVLADWQATGGDLLEREQQVFGWTHVDVAGWLFDEWGFPEPLRDAVTEVGRPEDGQVDYPVVRVVASLTEPGAQKDAVERTANRIAAVFSMDGDEASTLLEAARSDGDQLARYFS